MEVLPNALCGRLYALRFHQSATLLDKTLRLKGQLRLRFAGQITGCEGYVESAAIGLLAGKFAVAERMEKTISLPPQTTALGALLSHITGEAETKTYQPMNVKFGLFPPLETRSSKKERKQAYARRALNDLTQWLQNTVMLATRD